ncbi:MAG: GNAT family N-acetyltransferase [Pseudomonas sp.]
MSELQWRYLNGYDAEAITELFHTVYGEHYVYPDVYLPAMIQQHNASGSWTSVVVVSGTKLVGHSALVSDPLDEKTAELALNVVHPDFRKLGIATFLGRILLERAKAQGLNMLTIKQVSSTLNGQRLGQALGFQNTGLLLDYVDSLSGDNSRDTVVLGCLPLSSDKRPLPEIEWPERYSKWAHLLADIFGSQPESSRSTNPLMRMIRQYERVNLTTDHLGEKDISHLKKLPRTWLIHLKLRLTTDFTDLSAKLCEIDFTFMGIEPAPASGWYGLFQRGFNHQTLDLHCSRTQTLLPDHHSRPTQ